MDANQAVSQFMETRRSVRARDMNAPGPDAQALNHIFKLACRVPDHGKLAPWRLIVLSAADQDHLGAVALDLAQSRAADTELTDMMKEDERLRFQRAPCVVCVVAAPKEHPKIPVWEQTLSAGALCYGLLIAAQASGFAAQWLTGWVAYDATITGYLGLQAGETVAGFIHMGTYDGPAPEDRERPDLSQLVQFGASKAV